MVAAGEGTGIGRSDKAAHKSSDKGIADANEGKQHALCVCVCVCVCV